jgi:hypothetical protein
MTGGEGDGKWEGMTRLGDVWLLLRYARFKGYEGDSVDRKWAGLGKLEFCADNGFEAG